MKNLAYITLPEDTNRTPKVDLKKIDIYKRSNEECKIILLWKFSKLQEHRENKYN